MNNRERVKKRIKDAKHLRKPDAENTTVFRDKQGRWIFEVYMPK
jgi:hypothetical protein